MKGKCESTGKEREGTMWPRAANAIKKGKGNQENNAETEEDTKKENKKTTTTQNNENDQLEGETQDIVQPRPARKNIKEKERKHQKHRKTMARHKKGNEESNNKCPHENEKVQGTKVKTLRGRGQQEKTIRKGKGKQKSKKGK